MPASLLIIPLKSKQGLLCVLGKAVWWDSSVIGERRHSLLARLCREPFRRQSVFYCLQVPCPPKLWQSWRASESQAVFREAACLVQVRAFSASLLLSSKPCGHFMLTMCPRAPGGWRLMVLAMAWMLSLPGSWGSNPTALDIASKSFITHEPGNWWGREKNEASSLIYQDGGMDGLKRRQPPCLRCQPAASLLCFFAF